MSNLEVHHSKIRSHRESQSSCKTQVKLKLKARVNCSDARTIRHALEQLSAKGSVRKAGDEFVVEVEMEGANARELNRMFLSALRKVEKRTTPVRYGLLATAPAQGSSTMP